VLRGLSQGAPTVANCILSRPKPRGKLAEAVRSGATQKHPQTCRTCTFPNRANRSFFAILVNRAARSGFAPWPPGSQGRFC